VKVNFASYLKAALLPLFTLVFFLTASIGLFDWTKDAQAASFSKPSDCGETITLYPQSLTLFVPAVRPLEIDKNSSKRSLVITIHGFNSSATTEFQDMARKSAGEPSGPFDYIAYGWSQLASSLYSGTKVSLGQVPHLEQASRVGRCIAYDVANSQYTYVHVIGHSLGSTVADSFSKKLSELVGGYITVALTGLDAYTGVTPGNFGSAAAFTDHYLATDDYPLTNWTFANACNVDVTSLKFDGSFTGGSHGWPIQFYLKTLDSPLQVNFKGLGFAYHREYTGITPIFSNRCPQGQVIKLEPCLLNCSPTPAPTPTPTPTPTPNPTPSPGTSCTTPVVTQPTAGGNYAANGSPVTIKWNTNCPSSYFEITGGPYTSPQTAGWRSGTQYTYAQGLWSGSYNLRVRGRDSQLRQTNWSTIVPFTVGSSSPNPTPTPPPTSGASCSTPTITQPSSNGNFPEGGPVTIKWSTSCPYSYFEITGGPYTSPQNAGWITAKEFTYAQGLWPGAYSLRVQGKDYQGRQTGWSSTVNFAVGNFAPTPACSGNGLIYDSTGRCAGVSDTSCHSLPSLGLNSLKSVTLNSGWSVVISSKTDCSDEIGRYQQSTTIDTGVASGAKAIRLEAILPSDCPELPPTGGIRAYREGGFREGGGCRNTTLSQGGIPSFPAVGYPNGPSSMKFFGDHIDRAQVTVYPGENYTGTPCATYTQDVSDFLNCNGKVISIKVDAFTPPTQALNIASEGQWDLDMSAALDNDPTTWSGVPHGGSVGVVFPTSQKILGLVVHDRPPDSVNPNGINKIYVSFGGGVSGGMIIDNIDLVASGQRCAIIAPTTSIDARWVSIKLADSSGGNGFSDVEIFAADGGTIRPTIPCPKVYTDDAKPGVSAPPSNWVEPISSTLKTPACDSKTLMLFVAANDSFSDKCPSSGVIGATEALPCGPSVHFNGARTINLTDSPQLNSGKLSISICAKIDAWAASTFLRRELQNGGTTDQFMLGTRDGNLSAHISCYPDIIGTKPISTGWHVLGLIFDAPNGTLSTTIDGVIVDTVTNSPGTNCPSWDSGYGPLVLGNNRANADYFTGDIAWVKIATP